LNKILSHKIDDVSQAINEILCSVSLKLAMIHDLFKFLFQDTIIACIINNNLKKLVFNSVVLQDFH